MCCPVHNPGTKNVSKYQIDSQRKSLTFTLDSNCVKHASSLNKRLTCLLSFLTCKVLLVWYQKCHDWILEEQMSGRASLSRVTDMWHRWVPPAILSFLNFQLPNAHRRSFYSTPEQWFPTGDGFALWGTFGNFCCHDLRGQGGDTLLVSCRSRPGKPLTIL